MALNAKAAAGLKRYQALKSKMAKAGLSTKGKKDVLQRRWNAHEKSHGRKGGAKPKPAPRKRKAAKRKPRKKTTKKTTTTTTRKTTTRGGVTKTTTTTTKKNWLDGWGW